MAGAIAAGLIVCGWAAFGSAQVEVGKAENRRPPRVTLAVLPAGTSVASLADAGLSVGVISAGVGQVPAAQTYLDVTQGNRVDDSLYDRTQPPLPRFGANVPGLEGIAARGASAPAEIVPGLLASTLEQQGVPVVADTGPAGGTGTATADPALIAADRGGVVRRVAPGVCLDHLCPGLAVVSATAANLPALENQLRGPDALIALASPPPGEHGTLAVGAVGSGFAGDLTSDSTRTPGYVLSTDLAPTILARLGLPAPEEMNGEPIRSEGRIDPAAVERRADRMTAVAERRVPVVVSSILAWMAVAAAVALLWPAGPRHERVVRTALSWLGLSVAWMPLVLLLGAALRPSAVAEALLVGLGAATLAILTVVLAPGWRGLAIASATVASAYAIDVIAGSSLTALSLLGPDPVLGVRFYGIGNELEAILAVLVPVGVGAGLTATAARGRPPSRWTAVGAFLIAGLLSAGVFAAGRFGADVGAAIVLPAGAAVAAALVPGGEPPPQGRRQSAALALLAAVGVGLAALLLIDLLSGGDAHLTRTVLDAGGFGDLGDVAERRLRLSAHDFTRAAANPLFWALVAGGLIALARRRAIDAWLEPTPLARAGLIGAIASVAMGTLVNDSGATFLAVGAVALGAALAFAYSQNAAKHRRLRG